MINNDNNNNYDINNNWYATFVHNPKSARAIGQN